MNKLQLFIYLASAITTDAPHSYGPIGEKEVCKIDYFAKEVYGKGKFCHRCAAGLENKFPKTSITCRPKKPKEKELENTITNAELPMPKDKELVENALESYGPIGKDEVCKIDYFAKEVYGKGKFCSPCQDGFENKSPETRIRCLPKKPKEKELENTITNAELPMPKDKELVESELPTENKPVHTKNEKGSNKIKNGSKTNSSDLDDGIENDPENDTEGSNKKNESNLETDSPTPDTNVETEGSNGLSPGIIALIVSVAIIMIFCGIEIKTGCCRRKLKRCRKPGVMENPPGADDSQSKQLMTDESRLNELSVTLI